MHYILSITLVFLWSVTSFAQLSGTYTIGGTTPDYTTISAAISDLNSQGINGPVIFSIRDGVYAERLLLNSISTTATNTITFQGASQDSSTVVVDWTSNSQADNNVFAIQSTSHVLFKHITFQRPTTGVYRRVGNIWTSSHIAFNNCAFIGTVHAADFKDDLVVTSYSEDLTFNSCYFLNGHQGLNVVGHYQGPYTPYATISNCTFKEQHDRGVYGRYIKGLNCFNNTFTGTDKNGLWAIEIEDADSTSNIIGNYIEYNNNILSGNRGIQLMNVNNVATTGVIANNMIAMFGGNGGSNGIVMNGDNFEVDFNTIRIRKTVGYNSYALSTSGNNLSFRNNIFVSEGSPVVASIDTGITNSHNNFYTEPGTDWTAGGLPNLGPNSYSVDPNFVTNTDLHTIISDLSDNGIPIAGITVDFDGDIRDAVSPDIGADEGLPFTTDAGILRFDSPVRYIPYCSTNPNVEVVLKNYGSDPLTQVDIVWTVNGTIHTTYNWTGNLNYQEEEVVNLGTYPFVSPTQYDLAVYTTNPNGITDEWLASDTALYAAFHLPLSGTYTLGGVNPDFVDLWEMNSAITNAGLCGPTTVNIRDGIYQGRIVIDTIPGSSEVNTLTITSESQDSMAVRIWDDWPNRYDQIAFLDDVSHVTLSHLWIEDRGSISAEVIRIRRGHDITIANNFLDGYSCFCSAATDYAVRGISVDSNLVIQNNRIRNGGEGLHLFGNQNNKSPGFLIENNTGTGLEVYQAYHPMIRNNRIGGGFDRVQNCQGYHIENNLCSTGFAIFSSGDGDSTSTITNNLMYSYEDNGASSSWDWALYFYSGGNVKVHHNTLKGSFNAGALGVYLSLTDADFQNNIYWQGNHNSNWLVNYGGGTGTFADNNLYFRSDSAVSSLESMQNYGFDSNSIFIDPMFSTHPDSIWYPTNPLINNLGLPLGYTSDFLDHPRNLNYPDFGALEFELPTATDLGPDRSLCQGEELDALNPGASYLWSTGDTTRTIVPDTSGTYWVQVNNGNGMASDTVEITIITSISITLADTTVCTGTSVQIHAGIAVPSYQWSNGDTTASITASSAGDYILTITNSSGCTGTDTATVRYFSIPSVQWTVTNEECAGDASGSLLADVVGGQMDYAYSWSGTTDTDSLITNLSPGNYTLTLTDGACSYVFDTSIVTLNHPVAVIGNTQHACEGEAYTFINNSSGSTNAEWWLDGVQVSSSWSYTETFSTPGNVEVKLVVTNGNCTDTALYTLEVRSTLACIEYCIPTSTNGTADGDFIDGVELEGISNTGTGSTGGAFYNDYTSMVTNLEKSATYSLTLTSGNYSSDWYVAWIDYDRDGQFEANEELGRFQSSNASTVTNISFTVPGTIDTLTTRMRVKCTFNQTDIDPCINTSYGEVEDYGIRIIASTSTVDLSEMENKFSIYPNPTENWLHLEGLEGDQVEVWSVSGQFLKSYRIQRKIDVSEISDGLYFLKWNDREGLRHVFPFQKWSTR